MDRHMDPGIGASPKQVAQGITDDLFLAAVEPSADEISDVGRTRGGLTGSAGLRIGGF